MDLLVSLGSSTAFALSVQARVAAGRNPRDRRRSTSRAPCSSSPYVLFDKWRSGRARSQTAQAIRALAGLCPDTVRVSCATAARSNAPLDDPVAACRRASPAAPPCCAAAACSTSWASLPAPGRCRRAGGAGLHGVLARRTRRPLFGAASDVPGSAAPGRVIGLVALGDILRLGAARHVAAMGMRRRPDARRPRPAGPPDPLDVVARIQRKIRQGLAWAFAYNLVGIPLAAAGLLSLAIAGAAMALSGVSAVANALLLRRWPPRP